MSVFEQGMQCVEKPQALVMCGGRCGWASTPLGKVCGQL